MPSDVCRTFVKCFDDCMRTVCVCGRVFELIFRFPFVSLIRYGVVLLNSTFLIYINSVQIPCMVAVVFLLLLGGHSTCKLKRNFCSSLFITEHKKREHT